MDHLTDDDLLRYRDQEAPDAAAVARHLAACPRCRADYAALDRVLGLLERDVPEPPPSYERDVWMQIAPRLTAPGPAWLGLRGLGRAGTRAGRLPGAWRGRRMSTWLVPHLALAAAIALLLAGSFAIGRIVVRPQPDASGLAQAPARQTGPHTVGQPAGHDDLPEGAEDGRDGVLFVAVGEHLQRSELMLTEFNNVEVRGAIDLSAQQALAEDLVNENRLYRQSAAGVGQAQMASLLDDLERVLLEVAHAPTSASPKELDRLRTRLDTGDVLFKVRVAGAGLRAREDGAAVVDSSFSETGSGL